jgi:hypothetical protein
VVIGPVVKVTQEDALKALVHWFSPVLLVFRSCHHVKKPGMACKKHGTLLAAM